MAVTALHNQFACDCSQRLCDAFCTSVRGLWCCGLTIYIHGKNSLQSDVIELNLSELTSFSF